LSKDESRYLTSDNDNKIIIWDSYSFEIIFIIDKSHKKPIINLLFFDENYFLTIANDHSIKLWSVKTFQKYKTFHAAHNEDISSICITNDNKKLVYSGIGGSII